MEVSIFFQAKIEGLTSPIALYVSSFDRIFFLLFFFFFMCISQKRAALKAIFIEAAVYVCVRVCVRTK